MARIRTIKPEFPHSESMGHVSREARLCFIMLWTIADDAGRLRGNSRMLASLLFPYDDDAKDHIDGWLAQLSGQGCIAQYEVSGTSYIQIENWRDHQKIDKPSASKIPEFDEASGHFASPREPSRSVVVGMDLGMDLGEEGKGSGKPRAARKSPSSFPRPDDVSERVWADWCALRAKKRTTVSETVIGEARSEAALAGIPLERFLSIWVARGSQGLCADWLKPSERHNGSRTAPAQDRAAINAEAARMLGINDDEVLDAQS